MSHSDQRQAILSGDSDCELAGFGCTTLQPLLLSLAGNRIVVGTDRMGAAHSVSGMIVFGSGGGGEASTGVGVGTRFVSRNFLESE